MNPPMDFAARSWEILTGVAMRFIAWATTSGIRILIILALTWVAVRVVRRLMRHFHRMLTGTQPFPERVKRADTLTGILRNCAIILVVILAVMMVFEEIGMSVGPMIATAGLGGLAIGFGAQSLVRDLITGFFVLAEEQVRVGDVVQVTGRGGYVEAIGLRTMRLRDLSGNVHIVPHGAIDVVTNMTQDFGCYVFDVGVSYREDPDEVMQILKDLGKEMQEDPTLGPDILEPLEIFGLDSFGDSAIVIKARFKTKPIRQWAVGREFNRRIKKRFDQLGIEIPFPHVTLYAGQDKRGSAPPMRIAVQSEAETQSPAVQEHGDGRNV